MAGLPSSQGTGSGWGASAEGFEEEEEVGGGAGRMAWKCVSR